jgi:hypothetical protein
MSDMIKIDFSFESPYGPFKDALYVPNPNPYTPEQIQAMELERYEKWIYEIENPPPPPEPPQVIEVDGYVYYLLEGQPPQGAILIELGGYWYYRLSE